MKSKSLLVICCLFGICFSFVSCSPGNKDQSNPQLTSDPTQTVVQTQEVETTESSQSPDISGYTDTPAPTQTEQFQSDDDPMLSAENVLAFEKKLQSLGYAETGLVDGIFNEQTALAVRHMQWLNGMEITGEVDASLYARVIGFRVESVPAQPPFPARSLSQFTAGFMWDGFLKGRLEDLGYLDSADPDFDPFTFDDATDQAVREFQRLNGLSRDGVVDFEVWQILFSPTAVDADGESALTIPTEFDWGTSFFPVLDDPIDLAFDGNYLWVLHSSGKDAFDNLVMRIDPDEGLLSQAPPVMLGDIEGADNEIVEMIYDDSRLWFLLPQDEGASKLISVIPDQAEKYIQSTLDVCESTGCYSGAAMGFDGSKLWVTVDDRAWAINRSSGGAYASQYVGWLTEGEMAFDGKCMWMSGEAGLTTFHTGGDYACRSGELAYALPSGAVAFDGQRIWAADSWGDTVTWLDLDTGFMGDPIYVGEQPSALFFDGETLWVACQGDNLVRGVDAATGSVGPALPTGDEPVALTSDGERLWVVNAGDQTLQAIEIEDYQIEIVLPTATPTRDFTLTPASTLTSTPTLTLTPYHPVLDRDLYLTDPRMTGDDVEQLQERLYALGYTEVGTVDGVFGPNTDQAVRHFQDRNGLVVDGIVGPLTWELLFSDNPLGP
jgi:peptidoglycan hydrolase-like protein with peptidoglycan-binding domain